MLTINGIYLKNCESLRCIPETQLYFNKKNFKSVSIMISIGNINTGGVNHIPSHMLKCLEEALTTKPTQQGKQLILLNQG